MIFKIHSALLTPDLQERLQSKFLPVLERTGFMDFTVDIDPTRKLPFLIGYTIDGARAKEGEIWRYELQDFLLQQKVTPDPERIRTGSLVYLLSNSPPARQNARAFPASFGSQTLN